MELGLLTVADKGRRHPSANISQTRLFGICANRKATVSRMWSVDCQTTSLPLTLNDFV